VGEVVEQLLKESELRARKTYILNKKMKVAIDCRWSSRGFNAEEATVSCCDITSNKVLYHSHLLRKQKNNHKPNSPHKLENGNPPAKIEILVQN
jgi:hypothetical protein